MNRRDALLGLLAPSAPLQGRAQQPPQRAVRIGFLGLGTALDFAGQGRLEALLAGLRDAG